jgi:hypothetical protein
MVPDAVARAVRGSKACTIGCAIASDAANESVSVVVAGAVMIVGVAPAASQSRPELRRHGRRRLGRRRCVRDGDVRTRLVLAPMGPAHDSPVD